MRLKAIIAVFALTVTALVGTGTAARADIFQFVVALDGIQEVTAGGVTNGDLDGFGTAILLIDDGPAIPTISWNITVNNIDLPLVGAHIHQANAGTTGPIRIDFSGALTGSNLADADLTTLLANPTNFYVNVHNTPFPAGAIRGQLPANATAVPEPGSFVLAGLGLLPLAGVVAARRRRARKS